MADLGSGGEAGGLAGLFALLDGLTPADLAVSTDTMVAAARFRDRFDALFAVAADEFDRSGVWAGDGSTSGTAALKHHAQMSGGTAAGSVKTGRLMARIPELAERARDGRLSADQVAVIVALVPSRLVDLFAEIAPGLLATLECLSVNDTRLAMQAWKAAADADGPEPRPERRRELHMTRTPDGDWLGRFHLAAEGGNLVKRALEGAITRDCEGEPVRSPAWRRADAFVDVFRFRLDYDPSSPATGRNHPHLDLVVTWDGGPLVPARFGDDVITRSELIARYLCDARIHRVLVDAESMVLDYGREERTAPAHLFRALVVADRRCRWPGCDRQPIWCHAHHVWWWEHGGPTDLDNLVLLCSRHHHPVHEGGYQLKLSPQRHVHITTPTGHTLHNPAPTIVRC